MKIDSILKTLLRWSYIKFLLIIFLGSFVNNVIANDSEVLKKYYLWKDYQNPNLEFDFKTLHGFLKNNPNWSNRNLIIKLEKSIKDSDPKNDILDWFNNNPPLTSDGLIALLKLQNSSEKALELCKKYWLNINFSKDKLNDLLKFKNLKNLLTQKDYYEKINYSFYQENLEEVKIFNQILSGNLKKITSFRINLLENKKGSQEINSEIKKYLNEFQNDGGLYYQIIKWYLKNKNNDQAFDMLISSKFQKEEKNFADKWWSLRNLLFRRFFELKKYQNCYDVVRHNFLKSGEHFANANWICGWLNLKFLNNPQKAIDYFSRTFEKVLTPISLSTMAFWAGECANTMEQKELAIEWYKKASIHKSTFYGQIAFEKIHKTKPESNIVFRNKFSQDLQKKVEQKEFVRLLKVLPRNEDKNLITQIVIKISEDITDPQEHAVLVELISRYQESFFAVWASKKGIKKEQIITKGAYPEIDKNKFKIFDLYKISNKDLIFVLAHSIARQESNFDPDVTSCANAKGLMQLIEPTANEEVERLKKHYGIKIPKPLNLKKPDVNLILGFSHLLHLMEYYDNCLVLVMSAYNAGKKAVAEWIEIFGDPRDKNIDKLQWIESIPFGETRDYVKKVLANLHIYSQKLKIQI